MCKKGNKTVGRTMTGQSNQGLIDSGIDFYLISSAEKSKINLNL